MTPSELEQFAEDFNTACAEEFDMSEYEVCRFDEWNAGNMEIDDVLNAVGKTFDIESPRWRDEKKDPIFYLDGKTLVLVEQEGGGEGDGEYCHIIAAVVEKDSPNRVKVLGFVKTVGWYASYDGSHFEDGWKASAPKTVQVIEWA